jgi:hypothetical protein
MKICVPLAVSQGRKLVFPERNINLYTSAGTRKAQPSKILEISSSFPDQSEIERCLLLFL